MSLAKKDRKRKRNQTEAMLSKTQNRKKKTTDRMQQCILHFKLEIYILGREKEKAMIELIFSTEQRGEFKRCKELIITQFKI